MTSNLIIVKSSERPDEVDDPLEMDVDASFNPEGYKEIGNAIFSSVLWSENEGNSDSEFGKLHFDVTEAGLFVSNDEEFNEEQLVSIALLANSHGAVVMDAETANIISGGSALEDLL
jgi:hypothetical protein